MIIFHLGSRALRQFLSSVHRVSEGQAAGRPSAGRRRQVRPRRHQQQCKQINGRLNLTHGRCQHAGHGEYRPSF